MPGTFFWERGFAPGKFFHLTIFKIYKKKQPTKSQVADEKFNQAQDYFVDKKRFLLQNSRLLAKKNLIILILMILMIFFYC